MCFSNVNCQEAYSIWRMWANKRANQGHTYLYCDWKEETYFIRSTFARNGGQLVEPANIINGWLGEICEKRVVGSPSVVYRSISRAHCPWLITPWVILLYFTNIKKKEDMNSF
jgi:hypothetical protein